MICNFCGKTVKGLQNYGNDNQPFCYDCKIKYDEEQKKIEEQRLEFEQGQLEKNFFESTNRSGEEDDKTDEFADVIEIPALLVNCTNHPEMPAEHRCYHCNMPLCNTCAFSFPGEIYLCPSCVQKKPSELNPAIKKNTTISLCIALESFLALILFFVTASQIGDDQSSLQLLGYALFVFSLVPAIVGFAFGISVMPKSGKKPFLLRIAVISNIGIIGIIILATIAGIFIE
jgi:hypothetical protein